MPSHPDRIRRHYQAIMVACETADGLLIVHPESEVCEVCRPSPRSGDMLIDVDPGDENDFWGV